MSSTPRRSFTTTIDLTTRAQESARAERVKEEMESLSTSIASLTKGDLPEALQTAVSRMGWDELTPVQQRAVPVLLERKDVIAQSRTGSGKTGAFLLPLFERIDTTKPYPQALIMAPTRELSGQIDAAFQALAGKDASLKSALIYGGVAFGPQLEALENGAQVVIGTPGRILDHLKRKTLDLSGLDLLVLDEADEMLSMGFYPDMREIRRFIPKTAQGAMFSATVPGSVRSLADEYLNDPVFMSLSVGQQTVDTIEHYHYRMDSPMDKDRSLIRLIEWENPESAIIFVNRKRDVEYLAQFLVNYGHDAAQLTGDLNQQHREAVMARLRRGELRFLVATDVAARGIDISDLSHVFMYDVPQDAEYYVHRSGRTARAGKAGTVMVLATFEEERALQAMALRYGIQLQAMQIPTDEELGARVRERLTVRLEAESRSQTRMAGERQTILFPLVQQLAEERPELIAMMLDGINQRLHHAKSGPSHEQKHVDEAPDQRSERSESAGRAKRSKKSRG